MDQKNYKLLNGKLRSYAAPLPLARRYKACMRIPIILLLSISMTPTVVAQDITVGKIFYEDLRKLVEKTHLK